MTDDAPDDSRSLLAQRRVRIGLVVLGILLGTIGPIVWADLTTTTDPYTATDGVHFNASAGPLIELDETVTNLTARHPIVNDTINFGPYAHITGPAGSEGTVSGLDSAWFAANSLSLAGGSMTFEPDGKPTVTISGNNWSALEYRNYSVDDDAWDLDVSTAGPATITLTDVPSPEVLVLHDGSDIIAESTSANGNVTFTDVDYNGQLKISTQPSVEIRNERTGDLVTDENVTVTFLSENDNEIYRESTETGLVTPPTDVWADIGAVVADAGGENYTTRSMATQGFSTDMTIYLLPKEDQSGDPIPTSTVWFQIDDLTGNFPPSESLVFIERGVPQNGSLVMTTITADFGDADGWVRFELEEDVRYRIGVTNPEGDIRRYGSFRAADDTESTLEIGQIDIQPPAPDSYQFSAEETTVNGDLAIEWAFVADGFDARQVEVTIHEHRNESNVIFNETYLFISEIQETVVPQDQNITSWVVTAEVYRTEQHLVDDNPNTEERIIGSFSALNIPVGSSVLSILGLGTILALAALFGGSLSRTGAVVIVALTWILDLLAIVSVHGGFLVLATVIAATLKMGDRL